MSIDMQTNENIMVIDYKAPISLEELDAMGHQVRHAESQRNQPLVIIADLTDPNLDLSVALAGLGKLVANRNNPAEDIQLVAVSGSDLLHQLVDQDTSFDIPIYTSWEEAIAAHDLLEQNVRWV